MDKSQALVADSQFPKTGTRSAVVLVILLGFAVYFVYLAGMFDGFIARRIAQGKFDKQISAIIESGRLDDPVRDRFVRLARDRGEYKNQWMGIEVRQFANDLQLYQELISEVKPNVIIETGTFAGGMTIWLAMIMEQIHPDGKIITVDIDSGLWEETLAKLAISSERKKQLLNRIQFVKGSSTAPNIVQQISRQIAPQDRVMVLLDSLHTKDHVFNELKLYSPMVSSGSYLIVNDTDLDGIIDAGVPGKDLPGYNQLIGVKAAIDEWLPANSSFILDSAKNKFMQSCCLFGILKRVK